MNANLIDLSDLVNVLMVQLFASRCHETLETKSERAGGFISSAHCITTIAQIIC